MELVLLGIVIGVIATLCWGVYSFVKIFMEKVW